MLDNRKPVIVHRRMPLNSWFCITLLIFASGCAMCASPYDTHYAAYGGTWQRGHPSDGRVGSVFHPTGEVVMYPATPLEAEEVWPEEAEDWNEDWDEVDEADDWAETRESGEVQELGDMGWGDAFPVIP